MNYDVITNKIKDYLGKKVMTNCKVVTNTELGQDYVYHICKKKQPNDLLIPNISKRSYDKEDNTVLRICTGLNLADCLSGYSGGDTDVLHSYMDDLPFPNNGYYIYRIKFTHLIKPNTKLIQDVNKTNEHWLVKYDSDTASYKAELIGKMFIYRMNIETIYNSPPIVDCMYMVNVNEPMNLTTNVPIDSYCSFIWNRVLDDKQKANTHNDNKIYDFKNISKSDYLSKKKISATMLSYEGYKPKFLYLE